MAICILIFAFNIFHTIKYIHNLDTKYSWNCSKITCGSIKLVKAEMICGSYYKFEKSCTMINCTEPVKCE